MEVCSLTYIDEALIEKIAISASEKFWNRFLIFGNVSAEIIRISISARIIKLSYNRTRMFCIPYMGGQYS